MGLERERLIQLAAGSSATTDEVRELAAELLRILDPLGFEPTLPLPHSRTDTSADAARSMRHSAQWLRHLIYGAVADAGLTGMTCDEVEAALDLRHQTASARVHELAAAGKFVRTLRRRRTRSGRHAAVYVADIHWRNLQ
jgi:hypothetical protein